MIGAARHMTPVRKVLIAGVAGVCLVLLKLVQAGYYLDPEIPAHDLLGGYLTAGALVVITVVFMSFADESNPRELLMQGLTVPSFLVAALSQPTIGAAPSETAGAFLPQIDGLPEIALLLHPTVHAEEREPGKASQDTFAIETLSAAEFKGSLADGARRFVGRTPKQHPPHAYIIGKTSDPVHARKLAGVYRNLPRDQDLRLLQPEGSESILLAVGGVGSPRAVSDGIKAALRRLEPGDQVEWKYLAALINGQTVNLRTLSRAPPEP